MSVDRLIDDRPIRLELVQQRLKCVDFLDSLFASLPPGVDREREEDARDYGRGLDAYSGPRDNGTLRHRVRLILGSA
ncbi:MAG: hypothetical protein V3U38_06225 [Gemmatimonadota bacterium]